jgi:uncharacterized protein (DUF58 family)
VNQPATTAPSRWSILVSVEPTERTIWLLVAVAAVGVVGAALESLGDASLALGIGLLVGLVSDFLLAGSPRHVEVQRELPDLALQGEPCDVVREVRAPRRGRLEITDSLPSAASLDGRGEDLVDTVEVDAGERVTLTRAITLYERGSHRFGRMTLRTLGPLGLLRRRARHEVTTEVRVLPDLGLIGARAERLLRGQDPGGARRRRARAEGREFESLREYQRGDDVRLIEWKASARMGSLIVKRMQPETRQDVVVLLDTGRHLAGRHEESDGGEPRLDVALSAGLTLAAAALSRGDRVGAMSFAADVRGWTPPTAGRGQLRRIADRIGDADVLAEEADYGAAVRFVLGHMKRRAMIAIVTDVVDEPSARALAGATARLRGRHLPVIIAVGDPELARLARGGERGEGADEDDDESVRLAATRLLRHRRAALAALGSAGAIVVDAPGPKAAALAVQAYMGVKTSGRL